MGISEYLPWCEIEQIDGLRFYFSTSFKVLQNDPRRMESEQKSFQLHFYIYLSCKAVKL